MQPSNFLTDMLAANCEYDGMDILLLFYWINFNDEIYNIICLSYDAVL
jgi:hypothetical protein